ncbi:MAG TPA: hypothetical protein PL151_02610 [Phycisphaerae bacterium]|nr:hypothetical protein [Phycisphaerae bacterium]HOJ74354.1 hypothetical protein [Phycisphaerae bacterium]HOM52978.1 hypothetical protein [Phycisphaerae bacterium]HON69355.1 hypothetical protein [Phycisphaerae bacterium]HOQ88172.1 hypothetical protein [Phycisphaerae bacterium]
MNTQPSLLHKMDRTGLPLLVARLVLGGMFIWMGLAKTGYPELILEKTGLYDKPIVQRIVFTGGDDKGFIELGGPVHFLKLIREYELFPRQLWFLLNFTAVTMPWIEVLCGILLIAGVAVRGAAGLLLALLIMFTTMIVIRGINIYHAKDIAFCAIKFNCGCGGGDVFICSKLIENVTLSLLAVLCLLSGTARFCLAKNIIPPRPVETPSEQR